ncbi:MAG: response regulator transcription factor [Burkholderiales bacterium]|nr:response regulator transcription factor [Burkholderiales bacterium]
MPISLVLADDHPLVLGGLQSLLAREADMRVLDCCADGLTALHAVERHRPDILVLDVRMPRLDGMAMLQELRRRDLRTRVILLAAELRAAQVTEAAQLGVRGLLLKDMALSTLVQCIRTVYEGGQWPPHRSLASATEQWRRQSRGADDPAALLTARELQVVRCVARGLRNRQIASELAINEGTVKIHLHNASRKLKVDGRLALGIYARDAGIA